MRKILVSGGLVPTTKDTLLDARTRVATFSDIANIENPAKYLVITVEDTGKKYEVKKLASKVIGGIEVENARIDIDDPEALLDLGLAEEQRAEEEAVRIANEEARIEAENARKTAESSRIAAEKGRVSSESVRLVAEDSRVDNENQRKSNEQTRVASENARSSAESTRQGNETARINAENTRKTNETKRANAELLREQAEGNRASTFYTLKGEMQNAIQEGEASLANTEAATSAANQVVKTYEGKVAEQDAKLTDLASKVNEADEEDLTSENGLLKLKDRNNLNGMGYVILRKNKSFSEQLTQTNTIYEIRYDFDLDGKEVAIPSGCALKFEGGKLLNGILRLNYTTILNPFDGCFSNTYISKGGLYEYQNVFTNEVGLSSWFDGDDSKVIQSLASFWKVILTRDYNIINTNIYINHSFELNGQGHYLTIEKTRETEDEASYVFMSTVNPASDETSPSLNISITNLNVIMRSTIFGEKAAGATWGYRGVFMQAFGHNVVLDNVNINTNGTIITCWGYNEALVNRLGQLFVINSILKASMFIVEDPFKLATFTNSELSIDERDKFYYQDYVLSNMHDIVIDNCTVVGGIETKYRSGLGYSDIYVYNSMLDYAFAIYSSDNKVNVTITGCVFRVLSKTAVNTNTNGKLRYWGGINILSMERNLFDISFTSKYQMLIYLYGTVDNISINYNTFQNIDNNGEEFEKIIHSKIAISSIVFIGNRIITNLAKIIIRIDADYSDDNFINCKDNYINNPINTKLVINGADRKDLSVMLFREERKGYTSGRPSVLTDLNRGYRYFDITQKLPIIWNGSRWILGDGFSPFKHSGWGGARPTGTNLDKTEDIGFYFFDRNLGKPIFISSISEEGVITWVDAMGAVVE